MQVVYEAYYNHYEMKGFKLSVNKNGAYYVFESEDNLTLPEAKKLMNNLNSDFHKDYISQATIFY